MAGVKESVSVGDDASAAAGNYGSAAAGYKGSASAGDNGFKYIILIQGTEPEMCEYMDLELGYVGSYHACNDIELQAARSLNIPTYIAPRLRND